MKISKIRRKVDPPLIVSKRLPSFLKKEKITLTKNNFKKNVKYNQTPQFVQAIIKFSKKNKIFDDDNVINKNKLIYINNLLNEIPKNKDLLTSTLICEIYRCLYKLNFFRMDIIFNLYSILINNTINFSSINGYVNCNFKELINITKYLYHFQYICNTNIQSILNNNDNNFKLKIVDRYLKDNFKSRNVHIYNNIYNYIIKYNNHNNIDILIYSLIKYKNSDKEKVGTKRIIETDNSKELSPKNDLIDEINRKNCKNDNGGISELNENVQKNFNNKQIEENKELLIEYINSFYKLNDMFNFLLNKILTYFNENSNIFDFYNLKLLFFFLGKFEKYDLGTLEKISRRIIEEIEKIKTNPKLIGENYEENKKYNYAKNRVKKLKKRFINTFMKINSKEFLILPYAIGISMNTYFNNYLIEYVNIYILSLINSRVNCDIVNFTYCLIGYKYIMLNFFILFNIFLFKEKCLKNKKLINKYNIFFKKLINNVKNFKNTENIKSSVSDEIKNISIYNSVFNDTKKELNNNVFNGIKTFSDTKNENCDDLRKKENDLNNNEYIVDKTGNSSKINLNSEMENLSDSNYIFNMLLNEFQINLEQISLVDFDKNSFYQKYNSDQLEKFYLYYKNIFNKVYNYCIFLLNKYDINEMLKIYKNFKSLLIDDEVINKVYIEVLYEKIILNSESENVSSLLKFICNRKMQKISGK
ncbi:conserved Plasmodium protein, unknown function [Plasmodium gallinaceum]|uniref:Uncharacterized protein n=1 Tax=Plasmodium gallinaceum TaxID=5849 RepID=A0A1J1GNZ8_PLAGA|nr:conserved Plasmodium protein, unknown function [Plasmodium gallinaceum]CRG94186.1 conserved Plasmodium protein, unknown function [Plasmodium gallinaceum]